MSQPSRPAAPSASGHIPRVPVGSPLGKAVLAAFDTHADDILSIRRLEAGTSLNKIDRRMWLWPIQPAPGQQQRFRAQNSLPDGRLLGDWEVAYPAGPYDPVPATPGDCGLVVTPPRPLTGRVRGDLLTVVPHEKVWLETAIRTTRVTIAPLRACLAQGHWRLVGRADINGAHTLEYADTSVPASGLRLWVDAQTYLPVRLISHFAAGGRVLVDRFDYQFLPPTPALMATAAAVRQAAKRRRDEAPREAQFVKHARIVMLISRPGRCSALPAASKDRRRSPGTGQQPAVLN